MPTKPPEAYLITTFPKAGIPVPEFLLRPSGTSATGAGMPEVFAEWSWVFLLVPRLHRGTSGRGGAGRSFASREDSCAAAGRPLCSRLLP